MDEIWLVGRKKATNPKRMARSFGDAYCFVAWSAKQTGTRHHLGKRTAKSTSLLQNSASHGI